jgi:hypothetical protein
MEIPLKANVICADGDGGAAAGALVQAEGRAVTHVLVRPAQMALVRRMIPIDTIIETTSDSVHIRLTVKESTEAQALDAVEFMPEIEPMDLALPGAQLTETPLAIPHPPPGALIIDHGLPVDASDGHLGGLDALLIEPLSAAITHIIIREGHLWNKREVTVPANNVARFDEDGVVLDLNKAQVEQLPTTKV